MNNKRTQGTQLITRACNLLRIFSRQKTELNLADLTKQSGLHSTTAYRILQALVNEGLLAQDKESGKYRLGLGLLKLGDLAKYSNNWVQITEPHVERLLTLWGETIIVDILDRKMQVVPVVYLNSSYRVATNPDYDKPLMPHCISSGKIFLAHLPEEQLNEYLSNELLEYTKKTITDPEKLKSELEKIRNQGFATNFGEQEIDFNAVGAPIRDSNGIVIATVSIGGPINRMTKDKFPKIIDSVLKTANSISKELGYENNYALSQ